MIWVSCNINGLSWACNHFFNSVITVPIFLVQFAVITIPILNRSKCVLLLEGQPYSEIVVTYKLIPYTHNAGNGKNPLKCKKICKENADVCRTKTNKTWADFDCVKQDLHDVKYLKLLFLFTWVRGKRWKGPSRHKKCARAADISSVRWTRLYLRSIGVVEHAEDDTGHGVNRIVRVSWRSERGQVVLQSLTQHAVKGDVRPQDVTLLPAILLQLLHLSPQTV